MADIGHRAWYLGSYKIIKWPIPVLTGMGHIFCAKKLKKFLNIHRKQCIIKTEIRKGGGQNGQGRHQVVDKFAGDDILGKQKTTQNKRVQEA